MDAEYPGSAWYRLIVGSAWHRLLVACGSAVNEAIGMDARYPDSAWHRLRGVPGTDCLAPIALGLAGLDAGFGWAAMIGLAGRPSPAARR